MKPIFRCDYCTYTGTKEEVNKHEPDCTQNYNMRSCYTCKNAKVHFGTGLKSFQYECDKKVVELPENHICKLCTSYERREKPDYKYPPYFNGVFSGLGF